MGWLRGRGREWQPLSNGASQVPFDSNPQQGQNCGLLNISVRQVYATRQGWAGQGRVGWGGKGLGGV